MGLVEWSDGLEAEVEDDWEAGMDSQEMEGNWDDDETLFDSQAVIDKRVEISFLVDFVRFL